MASNIFLFSPPLGKIIQFDYIDNLCSDGLEFQLSGLAGFFTTGTNDPPPPKGSKFALSCEELLGAFWLPKAGVVNGRFGRGKKRRRKPTTPEDYTPEI